MGTTGYAVATKLLGDCRVEVECDDGATRKAEIRGSLRNKQFIKPVGGRGIAVVLSAFA